MFIELSNDELLLLDGKCRQEIQDCINAVKRSFVIKEKYSLSEEESKFLSDLVMEAETNKLLVYRVMRIRRCYVCHKSGSYILYRSGRHKGKPNYKKPTYLHGFEFASRLISIQDQPILGCCCECWGNMKYAASDLLKNVKAQIPKEIVDRNVSYKRYNIVQCSECGWKGGEDKVVELPALMGGCYPGQCPNCLVKDIPFGKVHLQRIDGEYELVEVKK